MRSTDFRSVRLATAGLALSLCAPGSGAGAAEQPPPTLEGIRPLGMGNAFVAVVDDRNVLYTNPAGLAHLERTSFSGVGVHGGVDDELFEVISFVQDHEDEFADFENVDQEFYDELAPYDDRWVAADAQAYVDLTRPYLGLGVYTSGRAQFKIDRGVYEPRVWADLVDDTVGVIGAAMNLGRADLRVGGALKGIWRRTSTRALSAREVSDFDPEEIVDDLEKARPGFSMDLGVTWQRPGSAWTLGAVARDAAGYVGGEGIDTALDLGAAWRPVRRSEGVIRQVLLASDLRNTLQDEPFPRKLNLGAEVSFPILALRGGFQEGYGSVGASLGLPVLTLDYAYYGRELGRFPGDEGQFVHAVEARIGY